jgi:transcriptional regulator with XRE-family HTH domain
MHDLRWLKFYLWRMDSKARARLIEKLKEAQGGRSQRKFADDLGVALGSFQNWLRGDSFPMVDKFEKIAASLGTSQEALFAYIVTGSEEIISSSPASPSVAEDVRNYSLSLSVKEKIRLLSMIGADIAERSRLEGEGE